MSLAGDNDQDKLTVLASTVYENQATWFLNAFWDKLGKEAGAEKVWANKHKFDELDLQKGKLGNELDEMQAHRFLEAFQETLTVRALRDKLRATGAIGDKVRMISLIHYLIFSHDFDWHFCVNAPQGDNQEEIKKAQALLIEVQQLFDASVAADAAAKTALTAAEKSEADAKQAQADLEAANAELAAQQKAYTEKTERLEKASESGGAVTRNKAKNELAQHLAEDPLPLRRAKIDTEAAVRKAARATKAAEAARAAASAAAVVAEAAVAEAQAKVKEAEDYLTEVKGRSGNGQGSIWWLERQLHEAKKYMPSSKGGIAK
eukprot:TRINITY_DN275_c0_g1_i1.p1 TRINITY_DN275_c0_g1~~TRINITY_DN275_c0_g1_i1.p1  ORF type:complete len:364 (-),score=124.54 TRINITY_DN275_c0_g1_i1:145-1101(-)